MESVQGLSRGAAIPWFHRLVDPPFPDAQHVELIAVRVHEPLQRRTILAREGKLWAALQSAQRASDELRHLTSCRRSCTATLTRQRSVRPQGRERLILPRLRGVQRRYRRSAQRTAQ